MSVHKLKIRHEYFDAVRDGRKPFEVRKDDRDYKVGDILILVRYDPETGESGDSMARDVTYVLKGGAFGIELGYVVLGLCM